MLKLGSVCLLAAIAFVSLPPAPARADILVDISTRFIDVPASAGSGSSETIRIAATLYQPRFLRSAPGVVYIHGWGGHRLMGSGNLAYYVAAAGYVVLSYTARGFGSGESEGSVSLAGPNEISDLSHVIDWLTEDPDHAIGPDIEKVGVIGGSYGGGHSFQIASDPRISAAIPLVGWTNLEEALFPNGVIKYQLGLAEFYGGLNRAVGSAPFFNYDRIEFELFDVAGEGRSPDPGLVNDLRARSIAVRDEQGNLRLLNARQPRAPIFIIQSWDDYLFPASQVLDVFSQISAPKQIYLGRTGHPPGGNSSDAEEVYIGAQVLRWFDHYLRGIGGTDSKNVSSSPLPFRLPVFSTVESLAAQTNPLSLYLKAGGGFAGKPKKKSKQDEAGGVFNPERLRSSRLGAEIPSREDMFSATVSQIGSLPRRLVYTSDPWPSATEMMGLNELTFFLSSSTSRDMDVIVRLFDVAPDGEESEITIGVSRVTGLAPDEIRRVSFRDFGDHWIFRPGHSLRMTVSNIDFPDFRPPGANDNQPSQFTIYRGKSYPSEIRIPVRSVH